MKIFRYLVFLCFSFNFYNGSAQDNIRESVSVHLSNSALITGETLFYSINVVSSKTNKYSEFSSLVYIEIINEKQEAIYQSKLVVNNGKAYGDFFVPSLVSTGSYQFIAYTRWMKNFDEYFHHPIQIINPFEIYESPAETDQLSVSFYPEGQNIVAGVENNVVIEAVDYKGNTVSVSGRVVDQEGEVVAQVASKSPGLAKLVYSPKANEQYKFIIEDLSGNFQFINVPVAKTDQHAVQVAEENNSLIVNILGQGESLTLMIFNGLEKVFEREVIAKGKYLIPKDQLKEGALQVIIVKDDKIVSERMVYIYPEAKSFTDRKDGIYQKRSLVTIPLALEEASKLSVSVRKVHAYQTAHLSIESNQLLYGVKELFKFNNQILFDLKSKEFMDDLMITSSSKFNPVFKKEINLLPDHRGEIISGSMQVPDSLRNKELMVAYSIIGHDYQVKMIVLDGNGRFATVFHPVVGSRTAYITSMDGIPADQIEMDDTYLSGYPELSFPTIYLDTVMVGKIVQRSIRNQIENAYFEIKMDSVIEAPPDTEYFSKFNDLYVLDDFNRFPTIKDSFVEYIPNVAVRGKKGALSLKVYSGYELMKPAFESQAFLDGLPVEADEILAFSPYRIESIGVISNRYFHGPAIFDGIISFRTKDGDLHGFTPGPQSRELEYKGITPKKIYSFPIHQDSALGEANLESRIPDFRDQLFWDPEVEIGADDPYSIQFFTSDTQGEFEVSVEGVTEDGKTISFRNYFTVK